MANVSYYVFPLDRKYGEWYGGIWWQWQRVVGWEFTLVSVRGIRRGAEGWGLWKEENKVMLYSNMYCSVKQWQMWGGGGLYIKAFKRSRQLIKVEWGVSGCMVRRSKVWCCIAENKFVNKWWGEYGVQKKRGLEMLSE